MSNINPSPVPSSIDNGAAPIHPAMTADSHGSITNGGASTPVGLPAVHGPQTTYAPGSVEHTAAVMAAQGQVTTIR